MGLPRFDWSLTLVGLCIFTFVVVTYKVRIGDIGIAIGVAGLCLQRGGLKIPKFLWLYAAFVLWVFVGSFATPFTDIALEQAIERLKLVVVMLIAVNALRTEGQLRFYLLFFLGCFVLFPVRGTLVGGDTISGRAVWNYIYSNPNDLAALSLIALGVAFALWFSEHSWRSFVSLGAAISAIPLLAVILLTQSRGAVIGLAVGMGPAMVLLLIKRRWLLVPAGLIVLVIGFVTPANVWERLAGIEKLSSVETVAEADPEGSAEQRLEIQKVAWRIFLDNPVFGMGLGAYPQANAMYAPDLGKRDTHNTYLNLAAETGFPGLALWCALFWSVLRHAGRSRRNAGAEALATQQYWIERTLIAYLVAAVVGTYSALTFPYLVLTVLWCSATILERTARATQRGLE